MNKTKRLLALLLALVMSVSLFACGQKQTDQTDQGQDAQGETTRVFTDSCGREVKVPTDIRKVAVSGPLAQMVVFAIAPDKMVGVAKAWDATAENYFDQKYLDLPLLGQLYGGKGELNLETLLAAEPDVVIDVGEPKSTMAENLDGLQEQTGIPLSTLTPTWPPWTIPMPCSATCWLCPTRVRPWPTTAAMPMTPSRPSWTAWRRPMSCISPVKRA